MMILVVGKDDNGGDVMIMEMMVMMIIEVMVGK